MTETLGEVEKKIQLMPKSNKWLSGKMTAILGLYAYLNGFFYYMTVGLHSVIMSDLKTLLLEKHHNFVSNSKSVEKPDITTFDIKNPTPLFFINKGMGNVKCLT